jgi:F-type H+-transporting ATPase subunit delta
VVDGASAADLERLGDDLFSVLRLLVAEPSLRRALGDSSASPRARSALADQLLSGKVGRAAMDTVSELVTARWSRSLDLLEGLEELARRAVLGVAEKNGTLSEVEDELFRFGRILDREPRLAALLADPATPVEGRVKLLREVLGQKVLPVTAKLLTQAVNIPRGRNLDRVAEELSDLAAARRDRYVAHVRTPVALTAQQEQRLTDTLSRLYERPISLQVEQDDSLLGGLVVRVGGEVIDGSVAGKLASARRQLPH